MSAAHFSATPNKVLESAVDSTSFASDDEETDELANMIGLVESEVDVDATGDSERRLDVPRSRMAAMTMRYLLKHAAMAGDGEDGAEAADEEAHAALHEQEQGRQLSVSDNASEAAPENATSTSVTPADVQHANEEERQAAWRQMPYPPAWALLAKCIWASYGADEETVLAQLAPTFAPEELAFCWLAEEPFMPGHLIIVSSALRAVIVVVRGTANRADIEVDRKWDAVRMGGLDKVHAGMKRSVENLTSPEHGAVVLAGLHASGALPPAPPGARVAPAVTIFDALAALVAYRPSWSLFFAGHSLGGAVAVILAQLARQQCHIAEAVSEEDAHCSPLQAVLSCRRRVLSFTLGAPPCISPLMATATSLSHAEANALAAMPHAAEHDAEALAPLHRPPQDRYMLISPSAHAATDSDAASALPSAACAPPDADGATTSASDGVNRNNTLKPNPATTSAQSTAPGDFVSEASTAAGKANTNAASAGAACATSSGTAADTGAGGGVAAAAFGANAAATSFADRLASDLDSWPLATGIIFGMDVVPRLSSESVKHFRAHLACPALVSRAVAGLRSAFGRGGRQAVEDSPPAATQGDLSLPASTLPAPSRPRSRSPALSAAPLAGTTVVVNALFAAQAAMTSATAVSMHELGTGGIGQLMHAMSKHSITGRPTVSAAEAAAADGFDSDAEGLAASPNDDDAKPTTIFGGAAAVLRSERRLLRHMLSNLRNLELPGSAAAAPRRRLYALMQASPMRAVHDKQEVVTPGLLVRIMPVRSTPRPADGTPHGTPAAAAAASICSDVAPRYAAVLVPPKKFSSIRVSSRMVRDHQLVCYLHAISTLCECAGAPPLQFSAAAPAPWSIEARELAASKAAAAAAATATAAAAAAASAAAVATSTAAAAASGTAPSATLPHKETTPKKHSPAGSVAAASSGEKIARHAATIA